MKKIVALLLALVMVFALCGCGKSKEVKNVETQIESIAKIALPDEEGKIKAVREAYDALTDEEKETVENYAVLIEHEYKNDLALLERALMDLTDKCEISIDMYGKIISAVSSEADVSLLKSSDCNANHYFECIMAVEEDTTFWSWIGAKSVAVSRYNAKLVDIFRLGTMFSDDPKFNFILHSDYQSVGFALVDKNSDFFIPDEIVESVFSKAFEYKNSYIALTLEDELVYEHYVRMRSEYGETHKEDLDAIEEWYFAVSKGVNYVINPTDNLSSVVNGWSEKAADIKMAERAYNLKR